MKTLISKIMNDIQSQHPKKRYDALASLYELKKKEDLVVDTNQLMEMVKIAAGKFPEKVDEWDEPSVYLLDFLVDFKEPLLIDELIKRFDHFTDPGKYMVLDFLCEFEEEKIKLFIKTFYEKRIQEQAALLVPNTLFVHPDWIKDIFESLFDSLKEEKYREDFFNFLYYSLQDETMTRYKEAEVMPIVMEEYAKQKKNYLKYDAAYQVRSAYRFWKEDYFKLRERMVVNLEIIKAYYKDEYEELVQEALRFEDPFIKMEAILISLEKNITIQEEELLFCAENIETSNQFYYKLQAINKEYLFPITDQKHHYFVKTHLFHLLAQDEQYEGCPVLIEIKHEEVFMTEYNELRRFYLVSFEDEDEVAYTAWVGAYATEEEIPDVSNESYTEFVPFASLPVTQHIEQFHQKRAEEIKQVKALVVYESSPRFQLPWNRIKVEITGFSLLFYQSSEVVEINHHQIKEVRLNQKKKDVIMIYDRSGVLVLSIPKKCVDYDVFSSVIKAYTENFHEPPFIEEE